MKALPQANRQPTPGEQVIEAQYKLKQVTRLLAMIGKEIGADKIIEIAKSNDYPKTDEQIIEMVDKGKRLGDLDRYNLWHNHMDDKIEYDEPEPNGDWVRWSDVEKLIG